MFGLKIVESKRLKGCNKAIRQGDTIFVSPAMYELIQNANEQELRFLLANIKCLTIPDLAKLTLEMTTHAPEWNIDSEIRRRVVRGY